MTSKTQTILVVDDEADLRMTLGAMLESEGYRVIEAGGVEEAERRLVLTRPDLITLDVMMPRQSGLAYYERLKRDERWRDIPVVFVSAFCSERDFSAEGFRKLVPTRDVPAPDGYLEKPVRPEQLIATVRALLDPGR